MDLHISTEELESVADIEDNCGRHISLVNDIYSYEKERLASQSIEQEGAILCNAVQVLANQLDLGVAPARHMLWILIREWEYTHQDLVKRRMATLPKCTVELQAYMNGLEYHMSGNELWSRTTKRYSQA
jgi:aristolochene synthase